MSKKIIILTARCICKQKNHTYKYQTFSNNVPSRINAPALLRKNNNKELTLPNYPSIYILWTQEIVKEIALSITFNKM